MADVKLCTVDGCAEVLVARGMCQRHYQAAWSRGDFDRSPIDRVVLRECPGDHGHASSSVCYKQHRCRCEECHQRQSAIRRRRKRAAAYGQYVSPLVPIGPVREHVLMLQSYGLGWRRIARLAGVGENSLSQVIYGRKGGNASDPRRGEVLARISRVNAAKILQVQPDLDLLAAGAHISSRGVHRRVQALVSRGWSMSRLARELSLSQQNFPRMMKSNLVTVQRHREVAAMYERLWGKVPSHDTTPTLISFRHAKNHAARNGWLPPLAWDDIDTDVTPPTVGDASEEVEEIDEVAVEFAASGAPGSYTQAERKAAVLLLASRGLSDGEIGRILGRSSDAVFKIRARAGVASPIGAGRPEGTRAAA
jgi:transcriptional regulator